MAKNKEPESIKPEQILAQLLAYLPGYLYWKNSEGLYLACNHRQALRLGFKSSAEAIGKKDADSLDELVMSQKRIRVFEENFTLRNEEVIIISIKMPLFGKKKRVLGLLNLSLDITQQRQLQENLWMLREACLALRNPSCNFESIEQSGSKLED